MASFDVKSSRTVIIIYRHNVLITNVVRRVANQPIIITIYNRLAITS